LASETGEVDGETGTLAKGALDRDASLVLFDDALNDG
jgi:hypothetical protein